VIVARPVQGGKKRGRGVTRKDGLETV
jgi:hypothetical protein